MLRYLAIETIRQIQNLLLIYARMSRRKIKEAEKYSSCKLKSIIVEKKKEASP